ncbi:hypothetical protein D3C85_1601820 [compost metagenome]
MINAGLIFVKFNNKNVTTTIPKNSQFSPTGAINIKNAAMIKPTLTALIPDNECLILDTFFKSFQKGTMKSTNINPGRLIPKTASKPPVT